MGKKRNAYMILVGKPEGMRPLGRPRHRWVDSIKIDSFYGPSEHNNSSTLHTTDLLNYNYITTCFGS
jgi:hypothetical protein